jgi:hypothetical protein
MLRRAALVKGRTLHFSHHFPKPLTGTVFASEAAPAAML